MRAEAVRAVIVWAALQALLALTVLLAFAPLGALKAPIAYAIATAKATLVMWFFMELRREGGLPRLAAAAGLVWVSILLVLSAADLVARTAS